MWQGGVFFLLIQALNGCDIFFLIIGIGPITYKHSKKSDKMNGEKKQNNPLVDDNVGVSKIRNCQTITQITVDVLFLSFFFLESNKRHNAGPSTRCGDVLESILFSY